MMRNPGKFRATLLASVTLFLLAACAAPLEQPPATAEPRLPKQFLAGQIIVALAEKERPQWQAIAQDLQTRYQLRLVGEFPLTTIGVLCVVFQAPTDAPLEPILAQLRADPRIELAQVNQTFDGQATQPGDPLLELAYGARLIGAQRARPISTGRGVAVAVIDTGVDVDHPALQGRGIRTANFVEGGEQSFSHDRHGTAVASVIGARADGAGLDGVAPDVALTVIKACWYADPASAKARCSSWTLAKAMEFAMISGAQAVNLSLNGPTDELLTRLLAAAHRRGVVLVAAAAEDREDPGFPAALTTVIPVISCDADRAVVLPRWRSPAFVAVAPGQDIVAAAPQGRYELLSGSSLAAAHVTGVVALLLQHQPGLAPDQVRDLLRISAQSTPLTRTARSSFGVVDACAALARAAPELACPPP
jgi:subtilisin family serine protease